MWNWEIASMSLVSNLKPYHDTDKKKDEHGENRTIQAKKVFIMNIPTYLCSFLSIPTTKAYHVRCKLTWVS